VAKVERVDVAAVKVEVQLLDSGVDFKDMWDFGIKDDPAWLFVDSDLDIVVVRTIDYQIEAYLNYFNCSFIILV